MSSDSRPLRVGGWIGALVLTAAGVYFTRSVLDVVGVSPRGVRVAMLPPWWQFAVLIGTLGTVGFAASRTRHDADIVLPLCLVSVLALPYLPWLPDRLPILRIFAGPGSALVWFVVSWLIVIRTSRVSGTIARLLEKPALVFAISLATFGAVAWRLTGSVEFPSGDEPHYLVITQSLLEDHDLKIENNHQREDYRAYFNRPLKPDYLTRGKDGQIYSIHPVGLPILAMPAFAIGGYRGVVAMLVVMASCAAVLLFTWACAITGSKAAATFGWAAAALTSPFMFNSFTVYPEIPGALAVLVALAWRPDSATTGTLLVKAVAVGLLPWLSTKYAPMAAATIAVLASRADWKLRALTRLAAPIAASFAGWFAFFYWIWGTPAPSAPYGSTESMTMSYLAHGGPGLLFDQEYGIVTYAPVLVLGFAGFAHMFRSGTAQARRAVELLFVLAALLVTVGAFRLWWGGAAVPGRPLASGVLLLGVPIASLYSASELRPSARAMCHVLLAFSLAIALAVALSPEGLLLRNERDGSGVLLEWLSPTWPLTAAFPSYIAGSLAAAAARTAAWLALAALVARATAFVRPERFGATALVALVLGFAGAIGLASAIRPPAASAAAFAPEARSRVPLLDAFDAQRRPVSIVYEPFSQTSSADALGRVLLVAGPGQRTLPQPVDLLWNARFSLPAGEYRMALTRFGEGSTEDAMVGLQIGRVGPPLEKWAVTGSTWEQRVVLPIDAALVGLRPLTRKGFEHGVLEVSPVRVVDETGRIPRPQVVSATHYGAYTAFFHDELTVGEPAGFWTHGRGTTQVTYSSGADASASLDIDVRCGPVANHVTLAAPGWQRQMEVAAGAGGRVSIPTILDNELGVRLAPLDITARDGFVPAERDAMSMDRRVLGCWIDMSSFVH